MKVLVFAHRLELGGTQTNAVELAAALRGRHGHDVVLFATPGPMLERVHEEGLRCLPAPDARFHPSPARVRALRDAVRRERPDLVHAWDWWQALEAYCAVHLPWRLPLVVSDMMMELTRVLPRALPTTFGTPENVDRARAAGRTRVELLLPPVDVYANAPGAADPRPFRARCRVADGELLLLTVCRLSVWLKSESLLRTLDAVRTLGRELPLRYVVVGDGEARGRLEALGHAINTELGRTAVTFTGALLDPRPAYAAADVVVGMGGSALRAMAFGKPVVVAGEQAFSAPFTPETAEGFLYRGMFGRGDGRADNTRLAADIRAVAEHAERRTELGRFAREFVVRHFSMETVSARLDAFCRQAVAEPIPLHVTAADALRTAAVYLRERRFRVPSRDAAPRA